MDDVELIVGHIRLMLKGDRIFQLCYRITGAKDKSRWTVTLKPAASAFKYLDLSPKLISNNHNVVLCDDLHHFLVQLSLLDTTCCHSSVSETKEIACERRFIKRFIYVYQAIKKIKGSTLHSLAWHPAS